MARIATDAKPGEAHVSENGPDAGDGGRGRGPGEAGELQATRRAGARRSRAAARRAPRRYSPVVMRIAAEHDVDLEQVEGTGRGGRVRKQDVLAFVETAAPRRRAADAHREPVPARRAGPPKTRKPRFGRVEEAPAPAARRSPAGAPRRSRACARRSASAWCSRCRPRRRARRSPRPT